MAITAPRVLLESTSIRNKNIAVQRVSEGSRTAEAFVSGANKIADIAFNKAADAAQEKGREMALAVDPNQIVSIDPKTGAPVALGAASGMGDIGSRAYRRVIESRYAQSIEEEITNQGRILAEQFAGNPDAPALFAEAMGNYLSSMTQHADGMWSGMVQDFGDRYIANSVSVITAQGLRAQRAALADGTRRATEESDGILRQVISQGGMEAAAEIIGYTPLPTNVNDDIDTFSTPALSFGLPTQQAADNAVGALAPTQELSFGAYAARARDEGIRQASAADILTSEDFAQFSGSSREAVSLGLIEYMLQNEGLNSNQMDLLQEQILGGRIDQLATAHPDYAAAFQYISLSANNREDIRTDVNNIFTLALRAQSARETMETEAATSEANALLYAYEIRSESFAQRLRGASPRAIYTLVTQQVGSFNEEIDALNTSSASDSVIEASRESVRQRIETFTETLITNLLEQRGVLSSQVEEVIGELFAGSVSSQTIGYGAAFDTLVGGYGESVEVAAFRAATAYRDEALEREQNATAADIRVRSALGDSFIFNVGSPSSAVFGANNVAQLAQTIAQTARQVIIDASNLAPGSFEDVEISVGNELNDVARLLATRLATPNGQFLNSEDVQALVNEFSASGGQLLTSPGLADYQTALSYLDGAFAGSATDIFLDELGRISRNEATFQSTLEQRQATTQLNNIVADSTTTAFSAGGSSASVLQAVVQQQQRIQNITAAPSGDISSALTTNVVNGANAFFSTLVRELPPAGLNAVADLLGVVRPVPGVQPQATQATLARVRDMEAIFATNRQEGFGALFRTAATRRVTEIAAEQQATEAAVNRADVATGIALDSTENRTVADDILSNLFQQATGSAPGVSVPPSLFTDANLINDPSLASVYEQAYRPGFISNIFTRSMNAAATGLAPDIQTAVSSYEAMQQRNPAAIRALPETTRAMMDALSAQIQFAPSPDDAFALVQQANSITQQMSSDPQYGARIERFLGDRDVRDFLAEEVENFSLLPRDQKNALVTYATTQTALAMSGLARGMDSDDLALSIEEQLRQRFPIDGRTVTINEDGFSLFSDHSPANSLPQPVVAAYYDFVRDQVMRYAPEGTPIIFAGELPRTRPVSEIAADAASATGSVILEGLRSVPGSVADALAGNILTGPTMQGIRFVNRGDESVEDAEVVEEPLDRPSITDFASPGGLGNQTAFVQTDGAREGSERIEQAQADADARRVRLERESSGLDAIVLVSYSRGATDVWRVMRVNVNTGEYEPVMHGEQSPYAGRPLLVSAQDPAFTATANLILRRGFDAQVESFERREAFSPYVYDPFSVPIADNAISAFDNFFRGGPYGN